MSECDTCPDPGSCCRGFELNYEIDPDWTYQQYKEFVQAKHPYFVPISKRPYKEKYVRWSHSCTRLSDEGRCMEYEDRPELCVIYEPKSSPLCVLHDGVQIKTDLDWEKSIEDWYEKLSDVSKDFVQGVISGSKENQR